MLQISKLISLGAGLAPVLLKRASAVELDWDVRQKSRFDVLDSLGRQLGVFLPDGTLLRGGDVLIAEDGSLVRVVAAPQPVLRIAACTAHGSPLDLTRAAYHLGSRRVPTELQPDHLKIAPDPVLAAMLRALHLTVIEVEEAFEPEVGACSPGGHAPAPAPTATAAPPAPHVHGPDGNHGHGHSPHPIQPVAIQIHPRKPHSP